MRTKKQKGAQVVGTYVGMPKKIQISFKIQMREREKDQSITKLYFPKIIQQYSEMPPSERFLPLNNDRKIFNLLKFALLAVAHFMKYLSHVDAWRNNLNRIELE